jgi:prophage regulatory protein
MNNRKLIKLPEVKELTTFSSATIYRLMKRGAFPKQVKLAERSSGWFIEEIYDWLENKRNIRDGGGS